METRDKAYNDYMRGMKYKDIAEKYNVSVSAVKSWAVRYWKVAGRNKKVATQQKGFSPKKDLKNKLLHSVNSNDALTEKRRLFCIYYVNSYNATQSYLDAYGGTKNTAGVEGCKLLKNPKIIQEIARLKDIMSADIDIKVSDMIRYCCKIVASDIGNYVTFGRRKVPVMGPFGPVIDKKTKKPMMHEVNYIDINDSEKVDTSLLQEIKEGRDGISVKLADKRWAWKQLAKYLGWDNACNSSDGVQIIDDIKGKNATD